MPTPPAPDRPPHDSLRGLLGASVDRVPPAARFAVTVGIALGLFGSIVLASTHPGLSRAVLWTGIAGGIAVALIRWIKPRRRRSRSIDPSATGSASTPPEGERTRPAHE